MNYSTGANLDQRIEADKDKDYLHEELASGDEVYTWEERPYKQKYYYPYNQSGSLSCVAGGGAITAEHFDKNFVGSRKDIYIRRFNYPNGGMAMHDLIKVCTKGFASEEQVHSQNKGETDMNIQYPVTSDILKTRNEIAFEAGITIQGFNNIDTIAKIVATTPVVCFWYFDEAGTEWWKPEPTIIHDFISPFNAGTTRHQVTIVDAILINGKKYLIGQDTAGIGTGLGQDKNLRLISSEMVQKRCYSAGYFIDKVTTVTPPSKPNFAYNRVLRVGMSGNDVKQLQELLRYLGYFKFPTNTGYFGGISMKAVKDFQKASGLVSDGIVGPLTANKLNQ